MNETHTDTSARPFLWVALGALSIGFHLWLIFSGLIPNLVTRPLHMALALPWVFIYLAKSRGARLSGGILAAIGIACCLWVAVNEAGLGDQYGYLEGSL